MIDSCRLCGSSDLVLCYTQGIKDQFRFHRCRKCRLVNYDLAGGLNQDKYASWVPPLDETRRENLGSSGTFRFLLRRRPPPGRLLDIGCGNSRLLLLCRDAGYEVSGLELSPELAARARSELHLDVRSGNFLEYTQTSGEHWDIVVLRHVLEHLDDPLEAPARINALLPVGGHTLLEFPNIDALDLRWKRFLRNRGMHRRRYRETYVPGHCHEYSRESISALLERTGFTLVSWRTYSHRPLANLMYRFIPVGNKARVLARKIGPVPAGRR